MRKSKHRPPRKATTPRAQPEDLASLEIPNHRVAKIADSYSPWPLLTLKKIGGDREDYLFVMPSYNEHSWPSDVEHPPSWMDPELLIRMARKDPDVERLIEESQKKQSKSPAKPLAEKLTEIFVNTYLPFVEQQFEKGCAAALADWLIANRAYEMADPELEKGNKRK